MGHLAVSDANHPQPREWPPTVDKVNVSPLVGFKRFYPMKNLSGLIEPKGSFLKISQYNVIFYKFYVKE